MNDSLLVKHKGVIVRVRYHKLSQMYDVFYFEFPGEFVRIIGVNKKHNSARLLDKSVALPDVLFVNYKHKVIAKYLVSMISPTCFHDKFELRSTQGLYTSGGVLPQDVWIMILYFIHDPFTNEHPPAL